MDYRVTIRGKSVDGSLFFETEEQAKHFAINMIEHSKIKDLNINLKYVGEPLPYNYSWPFPYETTAGTSFRYTHDA